MIQGALAGLVGLAILGSLGDLPIPVPISPLEPPARPDADGFPDVGQARFVDRGKGSAADKWGSVDCAAADRVTRRHGFRKLRVLDGDDYVGERCELGLNDHDTGPTALYREGDHLITYISLKLAKRFPVERPRWQVVMQMKQTQPADSGGGVPVLALNVYGGRWRLVDETRELWSAPVDTDRWTRFAFDVVYSDSPTEGSLRVSADLNGDGDALDRHERSELLRLATEKTEGPGTDEDGIPEGAAIPSHLRGGIYHDPSYRCEGFRCSLAIDDVGVYEPR